MNTAKTIILGLSFLMLNFLVLPGSIHAQNELSNPGVQNGTYNQTQPGTIDNNGVGGTNTVQDSASDNEGFNWWWLLPLIAIPIIYLLTRRSNDRDTYHDRGSSLSGAKGGRSERERYDDEM